jgi:putative oxidoreductase
MLSFIFKSKPNYVNFGLLIYRLALGISMFYQGYSGLRQQRTT